MAPWGRLRVLDGAHEGTVFVLEREVHTLGRGQASDFRLADPTVSRVQAELRTTPEGMRITGLSDKNPVWVNGEPAGRGRPIAYGDKVQCGLVHLVFEELPPPPPAHADGRPVTTGLAMTTGGLGSIEGIPAAPAAPCPAPGAVPTPVPTPVPASGPPSVPVPAAGLPPAGPKGPSCARCGAKEAPGARFCGSCGAALAGSVPLPATSVTRLPPPGADPALQTISPSAPTPMAPIRAETHREEPLPHPVRTDTMARPPEAFDALDSLPGALRGPPPPAPGTVLKGRFELRRHIAHGRVTEVYEGFDRETKMPVTVKVLLPSLAGDLEVRDWFFHAANAFVVAAHPSLLKVHSVHESGQACFAVTDLLYGVPLRDQIRARPPSMGGFDPVEVRRVGTSLCEGLAKLHEVGPHGDVVPGNVWVDPQGRVTLLDAGLSAVPGKAVRWPPTSDLAAAVYTAPEVLRGGPPTVASDLYAVGAVLYHMLTADLPAGRIAPVSQARPGLPPDLAQAVDRAMAVRPEDRFSSAAEMLGFLTGELEVRRAAGLRKRYVAAAAAAALLAVGASSVLWFPPAKAWRRQSFADPAAVSRAERLHGEVLEAEKALVPFAGLTTTAILAEAREAIRRGEAARADWRPEEAEGEFARALVALQKEERSAREAKAARDESRERAESRIRELDGEIGHAGGTGRFFDDAAGEFRRRIDAVAPDAPAGTVLAGLEVAERKAALEDAGAKAARLHEGWQEFAVRGPAVLSARKSLAESRALLGEENYREAEKRAREAVVRLRRDVGEEMKSLLRGLCKDAGIPRPPEYEEAERALGAAILEGSTGDSAGAAADFDRALESFASIVGRALEAVRASTEAREAGRRCAGCRGSGGCAPCQGTGLRARVPCGECGGDGTLDAPCSGCDAAGTVPCGTCREGKVLVPCTSCAEGKVPCPTCRGEAPPCPNPNCKGGKVRCLWCRDGVITASGPDKGKPCKAGCDKGWKKCPKCDGTSRSRCADCGGSGRKDCADCGGKGSRLADCGDCDGKGRAKCPACRGTRTLHPDCPKCEDGFETSPCPECGGRKACPACGGRGRKE